MDPGRMGVMDNGHGSYPPSAVAQWFFSYLDVRHLKVWWVYKRQIGDSEDQFFVKFYNVDGDPPDAVPYQIANAGMIIAIIAMRSKNVSRGG